MFILSKATDESNAIPVKIPRALFFAEIEKKKPQTDAEFQRTSNILNDHEEEK